MASEIVRPSDLTPRADPVASEVVPSDNGSVVAGVTWANGVNAARPFASQAEAEAGASATKAMSPLTTKQAIQAQGDARFASAAQGVLAESAVQPSDLGTAAAEDIGYFATAAQGAVADTAVQPGDLAVVATTGSYDDLTDKPANPPDGGTTGQALVKASGADQDTEWATIWPGNYINPEAYGMDTAASGATNKAALEAAVAAGPVMIPAKSYTLSGFEHGGHIHMVGQGIGTRLTFTGSGAGIHLPVSSVNFGSVIGNFTMNHETPGGGTHGIHIEMLTGGYFGRFRIFDVFNDIQDISGFGTSALYLDNTIDTPGFATGIIEGCIFTTGTWAGIHGDLIGDSVKVSRNIVNGGTGIAIDLTPRSSGVRQLVIEDNNLTAMGGQLLLAGFYQADINRNWMEHPGYMGNFAGSRIAAQMVLFNCYMCQIDKNTINGRAGAAVGSNYCISLTGTTKRTRTRDNYITDYEIAGIVDTTGSAGADTNTTENNTVI